MADTQSHYLGVDIGGSRLRWCVTDAVGSVVASGDAEGVQPATLGIDRAAGRLAPLMVGLENEHAPIAAVLGVAGVGSDEVRDAFTRALVERGVRGPFVVCGDSTVAAAAALSEGPGIGAWSGTGSFAVAHRRDGALRWTGGRGYLLGDRGSGFAIVRAAATAAVDQVDGVGPRTELAEALCEAFALARPEDLGARLQRAAPREVAAKSGVVFDVAAGGDPVGQRIVDDEASRLAALVRALAAREDFPVSPCTVGGGILLHVDAFRERFVHHLVGPDADVETAAPRLRREAAEGAARLARALETKEHPLATWLQ